MNFLQQLDEAASIPVDQLRAKMMKDPRVKKIFARDLNVDEIPDHDEFIKTLRYYVFSNPKVREYIADRGEKREFSGLSLKSFGRSWLPGKKLTQSDLDWFRTVIKSLFKDQEYLQKVSLSTRTLDNIYDWYNVGRNQLDAYTARELMSLPLRPTKPITVYRAFVFRERDMRSDGMSNAQGLNFLKSIRAGTRVIDLQLDEATSWSKDRNDEIAKIVHGRDASWKGYKEGDSKAIARHQGDLAFLVSTLASPDDIIVDFGMLSKASKSGWPSEDNSAHSVVVLNPGKHVCRVASKHTQKGEEDPIARKDEDGPDLDDIREDLTLLSRIIKLPVPEVKLEGFERNKHDPKAMEQIALFTNPDVQEKLFKLFKQVHSYYMSKLDPIDLVKLADQVAGADPAPYDALKKLNDVFDDYVSHVSWRDPERRKMTYGTKKVRELEDTELMKTAVPPNLGNLEYMATMVKTRKRTQDWRVAQSWEGLAIAADPNFDLPNKLERAGWAQQEKVVNLAMRGFYKILGRPMPDDFEQQAKDLVSTMKEAETYAQIARFLGKVKKAAGSADGQPA